MVQLDSEHACSMGFTCHILHVCAHKIDDIRPIIQSSRVHTGRVHDSLYTHACMSGTYMPNLDCVTVHFGMHANFMPKTVE